MTGGQNRAPERWISVSFLVTVAACGGFIAVYVAGGQPQLEGLTLAIACAGLAFGFVEWSKHLLPGGTYVEEKKPLESPKGTELAFEGALTRGGRQTPPILRRTLGLAVLALGAATIVPLRSLLFRPVRPLRALRTTAWRAGQPVVTRDGQPVKVTDFEIGTVLTVFPSQGGPDFSTAIVLRLDPRDIPAGSALAAGSVDGIVAFSKLCTHAGCPVGLYEQQAKQLLCPCHQSVFAVEQACRPIFGPAPRPLPRLPLTAAADGTLLAAGDFDGQVGPTYWRRG